MMVRRIINTALVVFYLTLASCYYDVEEVLYPASDCVTANMCFQANIVPILQRNCYSCHSAAANTGGITLEGHAQLMQYVNSGQLLGAINHAPGFTPMPQNAPKLIACEIAKIEQWVADGAPNN